ncbi:Protein phosphatase 2C family protein [Rhynchospora pubera]|uniref:protein-serine/threonine phosphatase n=1 Tax=Rhynchospora pubera TaxID=906938 RepID=A0AAV8ETA2_9POAL|nr:Protein phosphatase 2C family protein [Rhynchospora pubera]
MEDAVKVQLAFTGTGHGKTYDFYAVYNGHGGCQIALECRARMHLIVAEEVARRWPMIGSESGCWEDTMVESFKRLDSEVAASQELTMDDGVEPGWSKTIGSTALVAVVGEKMIIVANCGASRAVLCRGGSSVTLSSDHKPNRPEEMQKIEEAGGKVMESDGYRVRGVLTASRSIGDHNLKPCVIREPEVSIMERLEEDEFLILASDGLWDVISDEMACMIVRNSLSSVGLTVDDAASLLTRMAISRGSRDNISVLVVQLSAQMRM